MLLTIVALEPDGSDALVRIAGHPAFGRSKLFMTAVTVLDSVTDYVAEFQFPVVTIVTKQESQRGKEEILVPKIQTNGFYHFSLPAKLAIRDKINRDETALIKEYFYAAHPGGPSLPTRLDLMDKQFQDVSLDRCGKALPLTAFRESFSVEAMAVHDLPAMCEAAAAGILRTCKDAAGAEAVQANIDCVSCRYGSRFEVQLSEKKLELVIAPRLGELDSGVARKLLDIL
jgi:hypothetical protein